MDYVRQVKLENIDVLARRGGLVAERLVLFSIAGGVLAGYLKISITIQVFGSFCIVLHNNPSIHFYLCFSGPL